MRIGGILQVLVRNLGRQMACLLIALLFVDLVAAATAASAPYDMLRAMSPADRAQALQMLKQQTGDTGTEKPLVSDQKIKKKASDGIDTGPVGNAAKKGIGQDALLPFALPRLEGGDSLIVSFDKRPLLPGEQEKDLLRNQTQPRYQPDQPQQLYILDKYGMLDLQNVGRIPLAGLTEQEAAMRLNLEPLLRDFLISITRLPLAAIGNAALKPFGYELLRSASGSLEPPSDVPIPADYAVGAGDTVHLQLFGKDNQTHALQVSREGTLLLPGLGSIRVAGLKFDELRAAVRRRIEAQYMGVSAEVTLGELRSIRIFVLGEVEKPGTHAVSGFASMTHALYTAGGVTEIGSLRAIELKREGKTIETLDLYDLLLRGDMRKDSRLKAGDVVYVPPLRNSVSVSGEVLRPAIYELKQEKTVKDLLELAGGLLPSAYPRVARIDRTAGQGTRQILDVNIADEAGLRTELANGDALSIGQAGQRLENAITLKGHVLRPGAHQWRDGLRVTDIVAGPADLLPNADLDYALIRRVTGAEQRVSVISTNVREAMASPGGSRNLVLMPRDEILIFDLSDKRALVIQPLMDELLAQSTSVAPAPVVRIAGSVRAAGSYPLEAGMRVGDLVRAGGRLKESAFTLDAELTRFDVGRGEPRAIEHVHIDLEKVLAGDQAANIPLQPYDLLHVKQIPQWDEQEQVEVRGEVRFPGRYPIRRGETMKSLLERIGGLTESAYPQGAVFMRKELREREQERLDKMAASLEAELARVSLERATETAQAQSLAVAKQLLDQIRSTKAAGRLVIEMESDPNAPTGVKSKDASLDIVLRGGDVLVVPPKMQEVTVVGEVFYPTSHLYAASGGHRDYVGLSGGGTRKADMDNAYVVRANGSVRPLTDGRWFGEDVEIKPGDTIVVPLDAERVSRLALWTNVSQIVYQLGLAAAAWHTVGILKLD